MFGISVVIPTYQREEQLLETLRKLSDCLALSRLSCEVLVVIDGDEYHHLLELNKFKFNLIFFTNEKNRGVSYSRNIACKKAKYDWLLFLDDDDHLSPIYFNELQQKLLKPGTSNFYFSGVKVVSPCGIREIFFDENRDGSSLYRTLMRSGISYGFCIKKLVLTRLGYFNEQFEVGEDTELFVRLIGNSIAGEIIGNYAVTKYEVSENRLSSGFHRYSISRVYEEIFKLHSTVFCNHPDIFVNFLIWTMKIHKMNNQGKSYSIIMNILTLVGYKEGEIVRSMNNGQDLLLTERNIDRINDREWMEIL